MSTGIELIAVERERQLSQEGWTPQHDDEHKDGVLARAAMCYAAEVTGLDESNQVFNVKTWAWPWEERWWKPSDDPIRNLVKAGALIAAEIDRLQRKSA